MTEERLSKFVRFRRQVFCCCYRQEEPPSSVALTDFPPVKLLLYGPANVGKSTFIKNLLYQYGDFDEEWNLVNIYPFYSEARRQSTTEINQNVYRIMSTLLAKVEEYQLAPFSNPRNSEYAGDVLKYIHGFGERSIFSKPVLIDHEMKEKLESLWTDEAVQLAYERRIAYTISDSTEYFFSSLGRISASDYVPSIDDILRARVPTAGLHDFNFIIDGVRFVIRDMGGDKRERLKLHTYVQSWVQPQNAAKVDGAFAVIFMAALSDYNQEHPDPTQRGLTCLDESIGLFRFLLTWPLLRQADMILFLNKRDVFQEKLQKYRDFQDYFPAFEGTDLRHRSLSTILAEQLVLDKFQDVMNDSPRADDPIYAKSTQATDLEAISAVFAATRDYIINDILIHRFGLNPPTDCSIEH